MPFIYTIPDTTSTYIIQPIYMPYIIYINIYIHTIYYLLTNRSLASRLVESNGIGRRVDCLLIASYLALALVLNCPDHPEPSRAQSNSHILPADIHEIILTHMYICNIHIYSIYRTYTYYIVLVESAIVQVVIGQSHSLLLNYLPRYSQWEGRS